MTSIFGKWLKYVGNWLNYVINGLKMWNEVYIWEMAQFFEKRLNYVINDLDL